MSLYTILDVHQNKTCPYDNIMLAYMNEMKAIFLIFINTSLHPFLKEQRNFDEVLIIPRIIIKANAHQEYCPGCLLK